MHNLAVNKPESVFRSHVKQNDTTKCLVDKEFNLFYLLSESVAISFLPPKRIWHWKDMKGMINGFYEQKLSSKEESILNTARLRSNKVKPEQIIYSTLKKLFLIHNFQFSFFSNS